MPTDIEITAFMREQAYDFACKIINTNNQYSRLTGSQNDNIERTYVGKLGELVFLSWLNYNGYYPNTDDLLEIYEGQNNVDKFDFQLKTGESVDIKTGYKDNHIRLMVNYDQINKLPKDYYVGIKLIGYSINTNTRIINYDSFSNGIIYGYISHGSLLQQSVINYGYAPAHADLAPDIHANF